MAKIPKLCDKKKEGQAGGQHYEDLPFIIGNYEEEKDYWPRKGNHIIASFDHRNIILYTCVPRVIAEFGVKNKNFMRCPDDGNWILLESENWPLTPSFLSAMDRSSWASTYPAPNEEHPLALSIARVHFEELLRFTVSGTKEQKRDIRIRWISDVAANGAKVERECLRIDLRKNLLLNFLTQWVVQVNDIYDFVAEQRERLMTMSESKSTKLVVPAERVYSLLDSSLHRTLGLDRLYDNVEDPEDPYYDQL